MICAKTNNNTSNPLPPAWKNVSPADFITKADAPSLFATIPQTDDTSDFITKADAPSLFVTKSSLGDYITKADAPSLFATIPQTEDTSDFITKADAPSLFATKSSLGEYAKMTDISSTYQTKEDSYNDALYNSIAIAKAVGTSAQSIKSVGECPESNPYAYSDDFSVIGDKCCKLPVTIQITESGEKEAVCSSNIPRPPGLPTAAPSPTVLNTCCSKDTSDCKTGQICCGTSGESYGVKYCPPDPHKRAPAWVKENCSWVKENNKCRVVDDFTK